MMDRREFVRRLSAGMGAALTPGMLAAMLSGCEARTESSDQLTPGELEVLKRLTEAIIPTTDTPGAVDAGVPQYIEMMLIEFTPADRAELFRSQLGWVSSWLAKHDADTLEEVVAALDDQAFGNGTDREVPPGEPPLFATLKPLTVAGYYTSRIGATQELHLMPFEEYEDLPFDEIGKTYA